MKKITLTAFILISAFVTSQNKNDYYSYGYMGIEKMGQLRDSTVIYSNYYARPLIRMEVCDSVINSYSTLKTGPLKVKISTCTVTGRLVVTRKHKLVAIDYYYEKVEYLNGITEIYIEDKKKKKK
jgi:hypothetical protein